jgi:hypothetical protein
MSPIIGTDGRAERQQPVNSGIVVNDFNFNLKNRAQINGRVDASDAACTS